MNARLNSDVLFDTTMDLPVPDATLPRRLSLRATGLFAIFTVMTLAILLVAAALVFRGVVETHLAAVEQAHAPHAALLRSGLPAAVVDGVGRLPAPQQQMRSLESDSAQHLAAARDYMAGGTVAIACLAWLGITMIGALALLFFSRLGIDIAAVRTRAQAIVAGDRSPGRPLARNDELRDLAQAVDSLAEALGQHERDLEIERRQAIHHEKLATIGSMAAGVLREIGNPIAAIDGYARAMVEAQAGGQRGPATAQGMAAGEILKEAARLVTITHEISMLACAPASGRQLASLNDIVTQAIGLLRYEPRLEKVTVVPVLDPQLPAVVAVADRLVLLLINVLVNAADATAALAPRSGRIEVGTCRADGGIELWVSDNGCGMSDAVRERAFEPLFSTKPAGHGSGLGLPLCRAVAQDHGGHVTLQSALGYGTRVRVWLPLTAAMEEPLH